VTLNRQPRVVARRGTSYNGRRTQAMPEENVRRKLHSRCKQVERCSKYLTRLHLGCTGTCPIKHVLVDRWIIHARQDDEDKETPGQRCRLSSDKRTQLLRFSFSHTTPVPLSSFRSQTTTHSRLLILENPDLSKYT
jgi:hypothetical protein